MAKGKISRAKVRPSCQEYKRLFACALKNGKIGGTPNMSGLPPYLSSNDFVTFTFPTPSGNKSTAILTPNSYCYKGLNFPITDVAYPTYFFPNSLHKLRKYSGCTPRRSGSSSRFDGGIYESSSFTKGFVRAQMGIIVLVIVAVLWIANKQYKFI